LILDTCRQNTVY